MIIQNIHHKGKSEITKEGWKSLGSKQKLFKVIEDADEPVQTVSNIIENVAKAATQKGEPDKAGKKTDTTKK